MKVTICKECGADLSQGPHRDDCKFIGIMARIQELARAGKVTYTAHAAKQIIGVDPEKIIYADNHDDDMCTGDEDCACPCSDCVTAEQH